MVRVGKMRHLGVVNWQVVQILIWLIVGAILAYYTIVEFPEVKEYNKFHAEYCVCSENPMANFTYTNFPH
jgi:hypothetical protein